MYLLYNQVFGLFTEHFEGGGHMDSYPTTPEDYKMGNFDGDLIRILPPGSIQNAVFRRWRHMDSPLWKRTNGMRTKSR